jgi:hypothetical protein
VRERSPEQALDALTIKRYPGAAPPGPATAAPQSLPPDDGAQAGTGALSRWDWLVTVFVVLLVGAPLILTSNGYALDFMNHLWLIDVQEHAIAHGLVPTYFLNAISPPPHPLAAPTTTAFYPFFAFYGGTLYVITGALAALLDGQILLAYVLSILLSIAAAYAGPLWLARQLGVRSWRAHAPAITYVSSAYYISNLYGRGAWPEFVAVSVIPLLAAAAWRLARGRRVSLPAAALFVLAAVVFTGSHNITLAWGTIVIAVTLVVLLVAYGRRMWPVSWSRLGLLVTLTALSVGVSAWFLGVNVLHAKDTLTDRNPLGWSFTYYLDSLNVLFNPLREVPKISGTQALFVQLPVWFLAWAVLGAAIIRARAGRALVRGYVAIAVVLLPLLALAHFHAVYDLLPAQLQLIQFPYRLVTYATLAIAGLVLIDVLGFERLGQALGRRQRLTLTGALAVAILVSIGLCIWQIWVPGNGGSGVFANRSSVLTSVHRYPATWYGYNDYADMSTTVFTVPPERELYLNPAKFSGNGGSLTVTPPPGDAPFSINILAGPYLVDLHGLRQVGRNISGYMVATRLNNGSGPVHLSISLPASGDIRAGRLISLASLAGLLLLACVGVGQRVRDRRRRFAAQPRG